MSLNIDLVRKIDYIVGIPLCFLLSLIYRFSRIFSSSDNKVANKACFIELSEMGSAVIAYSSIELFKKKFSGSKAYFLTFKKNKDIIQIMDVMPEENILTIRDDSLLIFFKDFFSVVKKLRKENVDTIIDLELFSRISVILSYLSGAGNRVGFYNFFSEGLYRGNFLTHEVYYNPYKHIGLNFLSLVNSLDVPNQRPLLKKYLHKDDLEICKVKSDKEDKEKIMQKLITLNPDVKNAENIVILNPDTSRFIPVRKWPKSNYLGLTKKLIAEKDTYVAIIGTELDKSDVKDLCNKLGDENCLDLAGKLDLKELIDLYNISDLLITTDSGPAHFASMTDIRSIVLFGPETPLLYAPLNNNRTILYSSLMCSPCISAYNKRKSACKDTKCLKAITVDKVYSVARRILDGK